MSVILGCDLILEAVLKKMYSLNVDKVDSITFDWMIRVHVYTYTTDIMTEDWINDVFNVIRSAKPRPAPRPFPFSKRAKNPDQ